MEEFAVERPHGVLMVAVLSPEEGKAAEDSLLLLNFSTDRASSFPDGRYGGFTRTFLDEGHSIASFDLPAHGERVGEHGAGIAGFSAAMAAGEDPFAVFVEDGRAVIDELIERGLAKCGRIVASGVSRGGYCALRLAAEDDRIAAVAALAPVTDWRALREFDAIKDRPELAGQSLVNFADKLAGRRVYVAIGNADSRVGTDACTRFILALNEAEKQRGLETSGIRYLVVDDSHDHSLNTRWRREGIEFLLRPPPDAGREDLP